MRYYSFFSMNAIVQLTKQDYEECLKFILKLRYEWGGATGDFRSSGVKRDIGKYIHDQIGGKLAEIAFSKFCLREFGTEMKPDFEKYESQADFFKGDISEVNDHGTWRKTRILIDVKETKRSSRWHLIPFLASTPKTDFFIFINVDLELDQLLRYFKDALPFKDEEELMKKIPSFDIINAEILGMINQEDLRRKSHVFNAGNDLPDINNIFKERVRDPSSSFSINDIADNNIDIDIGILGKKTFKINGKVQVYTGITNRKRKKKVIQVNETWIKCDENITMKNESLGDYNLKKGVYKVEVDALTRLKEDNYGIPVRLIHASQEDFKQLINKI